MPQLGMTRAVALLTCGVLLCCCHSTPASALPASSLQPELSAAAPPPPRLPVASAAPNLNASRASAEDFFPAHWDVIGPFPSSAREQGADALEAFGGILGIERGGAAMYPSELASQWAGREAGRVGWASVDTGEDGAVAVDFGDLRWDFLEASFGSSIRRARGWAVTARPSLTATTHHHWHHRPLQPKPL